MLAAPEFIEAERVDLLDEVEVAAELQHRMLADRMMRGEEGSKLQACHGFLSGRRLFLLGGRKLRGRPTHGNCAKPDFSVAPRACAVSRTRCGTKVLLRKDYEVLVRERGYFGNLNPFADFNVSDDRHRPHPEQPRT
jgi:hypothetical protein